MRPRPEPDPPWTRRSVAAGVLAFAGLVAISAGLNGLDVWRDLLLIAGWAAIWAAGGLR